MTVYQPTRGDFTGDFILSQHRLENIKYRKSNRLLAGPSGRAVYGVVLQPLAADIVGSKPVGSMDVYLF
jgi:hypothetical protein